MRAMRSSAPAQAAGARVGSVRWWVLSWLLLGGIINYFDRANLSLAAPEMIRELGLTAAGIGLMGSVFSWTYALLQLPAGWLVDRFGSKRVYAAAVTLWSVATAATGLCSRLPQFLAARFALGIGESPCFPTFAKITATWFPKRERGLATGIWDSSSKWGPALAPVLLVPIVVALGWRALFYLTGAIGIVYIVAFLLFYRSPGDSKRLSASERELIEAEAGDQETGERTPWLRLFASQSIWGMMLGFFCTIWMWNVFLTFLPLYLLKTQNIQLAQLGVYASIPYVGGIVGDVLGGVVTNQLGKRGASPFHVRRGLIVVCAVLAGVSVVLLPSFHGLWATVALLTLALGFISAITGSAWALPGDVAPRRLVGSVGAIQNFGGYFGGAFSPLVAGLIVDATGSYALVFYSGGVIAALAAACYWFLVRRGVAGMAPA
jgi:MFS family permease